MRIAMSYDLRSDYLAMGWTAEAAAEFDSEKTIHAIETTLRELGHDVTRVGRCVELARRFVAGERWDLVFNICEGAWGRSREAQVPALCEAFDQPYTFCDPLTAALTLDKALTKRVVRDAGLRTPDFLVVEKLSDLDAVRMAFPLFAKPLAEGTGKGIDAQSKNRDRAALEEACRRLLERYRQPVLVEEYLPGREATVGIVGTGPEARVIAAMEIRLLDSAEEGAYSYVNKEEWEHRVALKLVEPGPFLRECEALALGAYRVLGCRDASRVDLRADAQGRPCFLEVNPLAGLNPGHSDLPLLNEMAGHTYRDLIAAIVDSAVRRIGPPRR
jgi:D-alanine-D-alanine ligase